MSDEHENWKWWSGDNDEHFKCGPCDTRQDAIKEARDNEYTDDDGGVCVVEARSRDLRMANMVAPKGLVSKLDENYYENNMLADEDDGPWIECTPDQEAELIAALRAAADEWQDRHGLKFGGQTFTASRNAEYVPATEGGAA